MRVGTRTGRESYWGYVFKDSNRQEVLMRSCICGRSIQHPIFSENAMDTSTEGQPPRKLDFPK